MAVEYAIRTSVAPTRVCRGIVAHYASSPSNVARTGEAFGEGHYISQYGYRKAH